MKLSFLRINKNDWQVDYMKQGLNKEAVFSDGTRDYCFMQNTKTGTNLEIQIRTASEDVDTVYLVTQNNKYQMKLLHTREGFDYYDVSFDIDVPHLSYYFVLRTSDKIYYYTPQGVTETLNIHDVFHVVSGFETPNWAKGAVLYQIFVDRFCNGDSSNDVLDGEYYYINQQTREIKDWKAYPDDKDYCNFYGGDLAGVIKKLDYLSDLGVEAIYLNPIFVSPSSHKYDTRDYDYVDPHYGVIVKDKDHSLSSLETLNANALRYKQRVTQKENLEASNQLLVQLIKKAHQKNIKVILDGVFNHCGSFHKWMDREMIYSGLPEYETGAYISKESPYRNYFMFKNDQWPNNQSYEGWWGHDTLPKLNYEGSEQLKDYIIATACKWVSEPYNADGWRLDVAADLGHSKEYNHAFWKEFRQSVKKANPDAIILAEHYENASEWLMGDQWDSVMNYDAFMEPVTWFLTGMEKHSDEYHPELLNNFEHFNQSMINATINYPDCSRHVAMNELSNHDHSRFLTRTNHKTGRFSSMGSLAAQQDVSIAVMIEAVVMQMTLPGAPTIYYGDEAGVCGWTDPDNRRTYPWGNENQELIRLHKELIRIHKAYEALKVGSFLILYGSQGFMCYARFTKTEQFIIVINNNDHSVSASLPVWRTGIGKEEGLIRMFYSTEDGFGVDSKTYEMVDGCLELEMNKRSSIILKNFSRKNLV